MRTTRSSYLFLLFSSLLLQLISSDTIVIIGGSVDSLLHPGDATVQTFGPCGVFQSDLPDLPEPRREFGACRHNDDILVCGGYSFLQPLKVRAGFQTKPSSSEEGNYPFQK